MASAPIFLTSADRTVTEDTNMVSCQRTHVTDAVRRASMDSMIPDRATAALRTSALPIKMMKSSLNPENACFDGTVPAMQTRQTVANGKSVSVRVELGGDSVMTKKK